MMCALRRGLVRTRAVKRRVADDDGTTLIELVVGMLIMTIFLGMFTTVVVMMNRAENKAESVNNAASQINQAFLTLDKTVRYAAAISAPGKGAPSGDWYVELRTTNTGSEVCTQFRVDITGQQVQQRSWTPASLPGTAPSFKQVAANISNGAVAVGSSDQPFVVNATTATVPFQQLTINLVSLAGTGSTQTTARSSFSFGAINSTIPVPTAPICQEEGRP